MRRYAVLPTVIYTRLNQCIALPNIHLTAILLSSLARPGQVHQWRCQLYAHKKHYHGMMPACQPASLPSLRPALARRVCFSWERSARIGAAVCFTLRRASACIQTAAPVDLSADIARESRDDDSSLSDCTGMIRIAVQSRGDYHGYFLSR